MGLEDIVKKAVKAPVTAAKKVYHGGIRPVGEYIRDVLVGYLPHSVRSGIWKVDKKNYLMRDQQRTFSRNLRFDIVKDLLGIAYGITSAAVGYLPGVVGGFIAAASVADLGQNAGRYVINRSSGKKLRPAPLWTEAATPWIYLTGAHAVYEGAKYVKNNWQGTDFREPIEAWPDEDQLEEREDKDT